MSLESNTPVDPRVQIELEKLNSATDNINKFEVELDDAKCEFKKLLAESVEKIKQSAHKIGNSIQAAKPYYEARLYSAQLSKETHLAAVNYEKAKSVHSAAKEMVYLAEQGLGETSTLDTACQEMLSHAASRVNESQLECTETRNNLKISELKQEVANNRVAKLQSQLKGAIKASSYNIRRKLLFLNLLAYQHDLLILPYYETRANYNGLLKAQKERITSLEMKVSEAKMSYNDALKNLEQISEEIHKMRQERKNFLNFDDASSVNSSFEESDRSFNNFPTKIESCDEYLDIPSKLSTLSSPIRLKKLDCHDCPHLLHDFENSLKFPPKIKTDMIRTSLSSTSDIMYMTGSSSASGAILSDDIEQWTEIKLSNSESSSSGYSHHSVLVDDLTMSGSETSSSDDNRKVTCVAVFGVDGDDKKNGQIGENGGSGISTWISRSSSAKGTNRRQSLDLLIDAGDKVKDVFTSSIEKVGKTFERRNSESEMNNDNSEFFLFSRSDKDLLSDEQVENLLLNDEDEAHI